jgi:two-component system response regulator
VPDQAVILIAEDLPEDALLIRRAFREALVPNPLHFVADGEETIAYLAGEGKYSSRDEFPLPGLLLLDLNMPKIDGFEVLRWIQRQPGLRSLRIVVLTSATESGQPELAYQLGAAAILVKHREFSDIAVFARSLSTFWLRTNERAESIRRPKPRRSHPS